MFQRRPRATVQQLHATPEPPTRAEPAERNRYGRLTEVSLGEAQHLLLVDVVDVDAHVGDQLRRNIRAVLLDVTHPVMGRVGLALAMAEYENRRCRNELLGDLPPVLRAVVLVGSRWVPGVVVGLVEAPARIGRNNARGSLARRRIRCVDVGLAEGDHCNHVPAPDELGVLVGHLGVGPFFSES